MSGVVALALVAGAAMIVQDVLAVMLVQAEARNRVWLAGVLDALAWFCGIATTTISVTSLQQGGDWPRKVAVIAAVSAANVLGTALGVVLGRRFVKEANSDARPKARTDRAQDGEGEGGRPDA